MKKSKVIRNTTLLNNDLIVFLYKSFLINNKDKCIEWGSWDREGYGRFNSIKTGKAISSHRFSYELFKGKIPKGFLVCHSCDNRKCVNPFHLFLGSIKENIKDMDNKKRRKIIYGKECHFSKLTEKDVIEIKKLLRNGIARLEIAQLFKVSYTTICLIANGKNWKHIK